MDEDARIFNELCIEWGYGERLDPEQMPAEGAEHIRERTKLVNRRLSNFADSPPIHFDFARHLYLNAWAFKHGSQYFIGYSEANEFILLYVFSRMFADARLLRHIGNPDLEKASLPLIEGLVGPHPNLEPFFLKNPPMPVPSDSVRAHFAIYFRTLVTEFIVLHELGHIMQGHIEYREEHFLCPLLAELGRPTTDEERSLVSHSLEMFADHFATYYCLKILKSQVENAPRQPPPFHTHLSNANEVLYYWLFSVCVFCRLFGDQTLGDSNFSADDHPPWRFRQRMILEAVNAACRLPGFVGVFGTESDVLSVIGRSLTDAEVAMTLVTGEPCEVKGIFEAYSTVREYADRLSRVWKEDIRDQLKVYPGGC